MFIFKKPVNKIKECSCHKVVIEKVALKKSTKALLDAADSFEPLLKADIAKGISSFQRKIDLNEILDAIKSNDFSKINREIINWNQFDDILEGLKPAIEAGLLKGAEAAKPFFRAAISKIIPSFKEVAVPFSLQNKSIKDYVSSRALKFKIQLEGSSQSAIEKVIQLNYQRGFSPRDAAIAIKDSIGLNDRQAAALHNYRNALMDQGISGSKLDRLVGGYKDQSIKYRAEMIARTETTAAINQGQIEVWKQSAEAGFFDKSQVKKRWIAIQDDATSEICDDLNGQEVGLDEQFVSGVTGESFDAPPAHVNCRSMVELIFI